MGSWKLINQIGGRWRWCIVGLVLATFIVPGIGAAQDDTLPEVPVEEVVPTDPPPPPPTDPPPTDPPPPPEPTLPPQPTVVPPTVAPLPTEEPVATEPVLEPTAELPVATEPAGSPEVTSTPEPTATSEAVLNHALAPRPTCELAPNQPASLQVGASLVYTCTDEVALGAVNVAPNAVGLTWSIRADVAGGWAVRLLPPVNDPQTETPEWTPAGLMETWFDFTSREPLGASTEPINVDQTVRISFQLEVTRSVCTETSHHVRLRHGLAVSAADATVTAVPRESVDPLRIQPNLAPIGEPTVNFASGLDFGEAGVSARGVSEPIRAAQLSLLVTGLDTSCGDWSLSIQSVPLTDSNGQSLDGSQLRVVAVNGDALANGGCDLAAGCTLDAFSAGPSASSDITLALTVELRLPEHASIGAFQTTLDATLAQTGPGPSSSTAVPATSADPVDP